jgi:PAS domain S-box-containing protein
MNPPAEQPNANPASLEASKLGVLRLIAWLLVAGPLVFLTLLYLFLPAQPQQAVGPLLILCLAGLCLFLIGRKQAMAAALLLVYGGWAAIAVHALVSGGGIHTPQLVALPLGIMLAGWLLSRRHAITLTAFSVAFNLTLALLDHSGLSPSVLQLPPMLVVLPRVIVAVGVCLLTLYIVQTYEERIGEVRRLGEALEKEHTQLHLVAENVPAMIAYNDTGMVLRYANKRYLDFFGLDCAATVGRPIRDIIGETAFHEAEPLLRRALAGQPVSYRGMRRAASGQERIIEVESVPDFGTDGEVRGAYALMRDITDQQRAEEALLAGQARLAEAQRIGRFGSWDLDLASKRLHWTEELFNIYECDPAAFGGTWDALLERVHPDDLTAIRTAFRESAEARGAYEIDHRILTPGGQVKYLHVRWEVFLDAAGKPVRALGTAQDITEQTLARAEIQRLNDELEGRVRDRTAELQAANKELESFAYSISHDLRAPLRGIDGFSHLLAEEYSERLDAQGRGYLERVRRAAQRMGMLIDDILELSRVTRQEMRRVKVDLSQIAAELMEECSHAEPQRRFDASLAAGCSAVGDPQLLRVLMQNLIENAWKYTGKAEVARIEFFSERINGETVFQVRDNGVGFDMQYAGRLFSPFQRLHSPEEFEGTGIGLATVARVVHRHGGRIWTDSAVGAGASFRFTLPEYEK